MDYYVYVLVDTRKPGSYRCSYWTLPFEPFYVGKGTKERWRHHISPRDTDKTFRANRIRSIRRSGHEFKVKILKYFATEPEAFIFETQLIQKLGRHPHGPLTNLTDGGDGTRGAIRSEEYKAAISVRMRNWYATASPSALERQARNKQRAIDARIETDRAKIATRIRATREGWTESKRKQVSVTLSSREARYSEETKERVSEFRANFKKLVGPSISKAYASRTPEEKAQWAARIAEGVRRRHAEMTEQERARRSHNQSEAAKKRRINERTA